MANPGLPAQRIKSSDIFLLGYNSVTMSPAETPRPEAAEAYKSSVMKRYELALAKPKGANCHDAAYYLLGIEPEEYGLDGVCYVDNGVFQPSDNLNEAVLVAFGKVYENELSAVHLATLHPYNKTKVIHRDLEGYYKTRRTRHNIFTEVADMIEQLTVGGNPIMVESLSDVQQRWHFFPMHLFKFRPGILERLSIK